MFHVEPYSSHEKAQETIEGYTGDLPLFLYMQDGKSCEPGKPTPYWGGRSLKYFEAAVSLLKSLPSAGLVTLPVSKEMIMEGGVYFSGHTQYLEEAFDQKAIMCMYHEQLSVIPLTIHIPLASVSAAVQEISSEWIYHVLKTFYGIFPSGRKAAITGLNPHAGEGGKIGYEEDHIRNWISHASCDFPVEGPLPADGVFMPSVRGNYSLVLACYHDQGLGPFKALFGAEGINITLGLPRLRVSPDHGPAYECAGKNSADMQSVKKSLEFALDWGEKWMEQYTCL